MRRVVLVILCLIFAHELRAQSSSEPVAAPVQAAAEQQAAQAPPRQSSEPALRRWLEFQTFTLHARYRFLDSNRTGTSHDPQYKEAIRARFNVDAKRRYTLNAGFFSGTQFIGTFDNMGLGMNKGDYHSHYLKQLFFSAAPVAGLELQYGGIYVIRGENTEITTYDDDGYIVGERASVRRPKELYLDEISVTRGLLGPSGLPNLFDRWYGLREPNYTQVLASKRFSPMFAGSLDYTTVSATDTIHAALAVRFKPTSRLASLRYEQYYRTTPEAAGGFAVTAELPPMKRVRLSGGYATVDEHYDGNSSRAKLNSEGKQRGRRFFTSANVSIAGPLTAVLFFTRALPAPYELTNRTRVDVMFQYDVLGALRRAGKL